MKTAECKSAYDAERRTLASKLNEGQVAPDLRFPQLIVAENTSRKVEVTPRRFASNVGAAGTFRIVTLWDEL